MRSNRDIFVHRSLMPYVPQEFKKQDPSYYQYSRPLTYRYVFDHFVVVHDLIEMPPIIRNYTEESYYLIPNVTFNVKSDKTFFLPDDKEPRPIKCSDKTFFLPDDKEPRPIKCIDMDYKPEDFNTKLNSNYVKMHPAVWDEKSGVRNKIREMTALYGNELKNIGIRDVTPINLDSLDSVSRIEELLSIYQQHNHFYNHDSRKIAKWIYWSFMDHFYSNAISQFRQTFGDVPMNINLQQICHRQTMDAIMHHFGSNVAFEVFKGGSFFGKNRTVEAMQDMGIMDDRKYTSNGYFSGKRCCMFSNTPTISPSGKEAKLRAGDHPDVWEGPRNTNPPSHAKLIWKPR